MLSNRRPQALRCRAPSRAGRDNFHRLYGTAAQGRYNAVTESVLFHQSQKMSEAYPMAHSLTAFLIAHPRVCGQVGSHLQPSLTTANSVPATHSAVRKLTPCWPAARQL